MKIYAVHTVEDNELFVKDYIDTHLPDIKAIVPVTSSVEEVDGRKLLVFSRALEEYVLLVSNDPIDDHIKTLNRLSGVVKVLSSSNTSGADIEEIPEAEAMSFLGDMSKDEIKSLRTGLVNIISGQHAGRRGKVVSYKAPLLKVNVISAISKKKVATILVALWDIVKVLDGEVK